MEPPLSEGGGAEAPSPAPQGGDGGQVAGGGRYVCVYCSVPFKLHPVSKVPTDGIKCISAQALAESYVLVRLPR